MTKGAYMDFKYKITLFTPTYNRGYILETLYKCRYSCKKLSASVKYAACQ